MSFALAGGGVTIGGEVFGRERGTGAGWQYEFCFFPINHWEIDNFGGETYEVMAAFRRVP